MEEVKPLESFPATSADSLEVMQKRIQQLEEKNRELVERIRVLSLDNRDQIQLIAALLEKTPFGIVIMDNHRRVVRINRAAERMLSLQRVTTIGLDCSKVFDCYAFDEHCPVLEGHIQFDRSETRCVCPNADSLTLLRSTVIAQNQGEEIILEAFVDISEIKKAELAIMESSKAKDEFLAKMSHELRTPLNAIIGYSDLLREDLAEDASYATQLQFIETIYKSGDDMLHMVNDLLDISLFQANKMKLIPEPTELAPILQDLEVMIRPQLAAKENQLHLDYPADHSTFTVDPYRLRQVLSNLLTNANKFTQYGHIFMQVEEDIPEQSMIFRVRDTGIGMTEQEQQRIFNTFEQADNSTTRQFGGAGLGLSIVKEFVNLMDGEIEVTSMPYEGSTFTIRLPLN